MTTKKDEPQAEEFSFTDWLVEGMEGMSAKGKAHDFVPAEFKAHVKAAHREGLIALRSLLDNAISWFEEEEPKPKKATKIKVE